MKICKSAITSLLRLKGKISKTKFNIKIYFQFDALTFTSIYKQYSNRNLVLNYINGMHQRNAMLMQVSFVHQSE